LKKQSSYTDGRINDDEILKKVVPHNPTPAHPSTQNVKIEEEIKVPPKTDSAYIRPSSDTKQHVP
jgi:hypothetical protein